MDRRQFCSLSAAAGAGWLAVRCASVAPAAEQPSGSTGSGVLMKLGCQRYDPDLQENVEYYQRHEVKVVHRGVAGQTTEELIKIRQRLATCGLDLLGRIHVNFGAILKGGPDREQHLRTIRQEIRAAGEAGISTLLYIFTAPGTFRTEPTRGRGGVSYPSWDLDKARKHPPVSELGPLTAERSWEGITQFLEQVLPVAEQHRVRLACHPHDPPYPREGLGGIVRVLGTVEGLQRLVSLAASDYHGLNFCQGTVAEMLADPGQEIFDVIRWFGERKKIFNVHFRNIRGRRDTFQEVYPDEGAVDMLKALRVYRDVGYAGAIMPDHLPSHPADPDQRQAFAYAYGYIRALLQAVDAERDLLARPRRDGDGG